MPKLVAFGAFGAPSAIQKTIAQSDEALYHPYDAHARVSA